MPKNKGQNAFYFFMMDFMKRERAAGESYPNGLRDVQQDPKCSEEWKNLPKQKRGYYEAKAKGSKVTAQGCIEKKASDGTPLWVLEERQRKVTEFENKMIEYINSIVEMGVKHNNLAKIKFIFIHSSSFCKRINKDYEEDYIPAEFALCEFSLEDGVENTYHEIIKATIPLGYGREAIETSEKFHKIPIDFAEGESDYAVMYQRLFNFLKPHVTGTAYPPLFTSNMHKQPVCSLLNRIAEANDLDGEIFRIYSLEQLFMAVRNGAFQNQNDIAMRFTIAEQEIKKDSFCFTRGLACKFHEPIDSAPEFCSLSIVKRWGFTIADHCCQSLNIKMIPGKHCPKQLTNNEIDNLADKITTLHFNRPQVLSMTGVSASYKEKVSSRTYFEEQRRRNESKPVEVIDHSKVLEDDYENETVVIPECSRPLRLPKTLSQAQMLNNDAPHLDNENFPPIGGRGKLIRKAANLQKRGLGRGPSGA